MGFDKVMASAMLHYGNDDITITLHAMHLPSPHVLQKNIYVLWAVRGTQTENVGALAKHYMMADVRATAMMSTLDKLIVTAENSPRARRLLGKTVLSGVVG
jgi:hypothetical protein